MAYYSFPIESPKGKRDFGAAQIRAKGADGKEIKLGDKDEVKPKPESKFFSLFKRAQVQATAMDKDESNIDKYRDILSKVKSSVDDKDAEVKEDKMEEYKNRFYKIKFDKK